jgi:superfamily II DNA/RNA helicase
VLAGDSVLLASQTGSGKTLAYLVPTILKAPPPPRTRGGLDSPVTLLQHRAEEQGGLGFPKPKRPRIIVLVPSRELCDQVVATNQSPVPSATAALCTNSLYRRPLLFCFFSLTKRH